MSKPFFNLDEGTSQIDWITQASGTKSRKYEIPDELIEEFLENDKIHIDFQSNLTNKVIESLIEYKTCNLITYEASSKLHKPLIKVMTDHYNKVNNTNFNYCPIT